MPQTAVSFAHSIALSDIVFPFVSFGGQQKTEAKVMENQSSKSFDVGQR